MLRRTRADKVADVYLSFFQRWPTIKSFLDAPESDLDSVLAPLGLSWRNRNIIALREQLQDRELILTYPELTRLTGVGDYVASAVLCFSGTESRELVDVNTVRVICRVFGVPITDTVRRRKDFRQLAKSLAPAGSDNMLYNYALLDLAALTCRATKPRCGVCPLKSICMTGLKENHPLDLEVSSSAQSDHL